MDKIAIIVAAGSGTRMGSSVPKQFLPLAGKAILLHSVEAFIGACEDIRIILVLPQDQTDYGTALLAQQPYSGQVTITAGGNSRFESVARGLARIPDDCIVFVHDGVRCLVTAALIQRCYQQALITGSAIPACPATDSMRIIEGNEARRRSRVIDREYIRLIQTPQTFKSSLLKKAFEQPYQPGFTDEASVLEAMGQEVTLVEGEAENIKITRQVDLIIAEAILAKRKK